MNVLKIFKVKQLNKQLNTTVIRRKPPLFIRIIATVVLTAFIWTFVMFDAVYGVTVQIQDVRKAQQVINKLEEFVLPYRFGRIVEQYVSDTNNQIKVVLIQDLHCHPEVQKNIYEIIRLFDKKYKVDKILIEGAPKGKFEPTIFTSIPDAKLKKLTADSLLERGLLSGAEYYEIITNSGKLYGIEDWDVYIDNYRRIKKLIDNKGRNSELVKSLRLKVDKVKDRYLSKDVKKFAVWFDRHKDVKLYDELEKFAKKFEISLEFYPEVKKYIEILKLSKKLNVKRVGYELREYFKDLQRVLPYGVFSKLQDKLNNQQAIEEYYLGLISVTEQYGKNIIKRYPNLLRFFDYIKLNFEINPSYLVIEERLLKREIITRYVKKLLDKEVLKLSFMTECLSDLVDLKITPQDYKYFKQNKNDYVILLKKYFDENEVAKVLEVLKDDDYIKFYEVNIKRNDIFFGSLKTVLNLDVGQTFKVASNNSELITNNSKPLTTDSYSLLTIFITGGFHKELTDYFKKHDISYISIIPNATKDYDEKIYEKLVLGGFDFGDFINSAFAVLMSATLQEIEIPQEARLGYIKSILESLTSTREIKIEEVNKLLNEWASELENRQDIDEKVKSELIRLLRTTQLRKISSDKYIIEINGERYEVIVNKNGEVVEVKGLTGKGLVEKKSRMDVAGREVGWRWGNEALAALERITSFNLFFKGRKKIGEKEQEVPRYYGKFKLAVISVVLIAVMALSTILGILPVAVFIPLWLGIIFSSFIYSYVAMHINRRWIKDVGNEIDQQTLREKILSGSIIPSWLILPLEVVGASVGPALAMEQSMRALLISISMSLPVSIIFGVYIGRRTLVNALFALIDKIVKKLKRQEPLTTLSKNFKKVIEILIKPYVGDLEKLLHEYYQAKKIGDEKKMDEITKKIEEIVNIVNSFTLRNPEVNPNDIKIPDVLLLDKFLLTDQAREWLDKAKEAVVDGEYVPHFMFGGAATRLFDSIKKALKGSDIELNPKDYRMYLLDLWKVIKMLKDNIEIVRKNNAQLASLVEKISDEDIRLGLGMGQRQIVAYVEKIKRLAIEKGKNPQEVFSKQKIILHISEDIRDVVIDDFVRNNFYGLNPENVYFIVDPLFKGYTIRDGRLERVEESEMLPYTHGYATTQLILKDRTFKLTKDKKIVKIKDDILSELLKSGVKYIGTHRVNDLTKFLIDEPQKIAGVLQRV